MTDYKIYETILEINEPFKKIVNIIFKWVKWNFLINIY